jgi:pimeloyl-ACP methyl ester carboxylesterase
VESGGVEQTSVEVAAGLSLAVRRWSGAGPRFLLVHGLSSNARMWDGVAASLAATGGDVAAVDLRGHGRSGKPDHGYSTPEVAADLVPVLDALGWPDAVLAGQSWGCNVVLELAAQVPRRVRAVACVDGGLGDVAERFPTWEECERALAPPRLEGLPAAGFADRVRAMHPDWPESGIEGVLGCFEVRDDATLAPWLTYARHLEVLRGMWEHRLGPVLARLTMPVLFLPADNPATPEWTAAKRAAAEVTLAALADGRIVWMAGEHDLHAQHPQAVADQLRSLAAG